MWPHSRPRIWLYPHSASLILGCMAAVPHTRPYGHSACPIPGWMGTGPAPYPAIWWQCRPHTSLCGSASRISGCMAALPAPYLAVSGQGVLQQSRRLAHTLTDVTVLLLQLLPAPLERRSLLGAQLQQLRRHSLQLPHQRPVLGNGLPQVLAAGRAAGVNWGGIFPVAYPPHTPQGCVLLLPEDSCWLGAPARWSPCGDATPISSPPHSQPAERVPSAPALPTPAATPAAP